MKNFRKNEILSLLSISVLAIPTIVGLSCKQTNKQNEITASEQEVINGVLNSIEIKPKQGININDVLATDINKQNFDQYFDLSWNKQINPELKIQVDSIEQNYNNLTSIIVTVKITYKQTNWTKEIKLEEFKSPNFISLIKSNFNIQDFNISSDIFAEQFKTNITKQWIFNNKDKIFKGNFNIEDISEPQVEIWNSVYIKIVVNIKNNEYNFQIGEFKLKDENENLDTLKNEFQSNELNLQDKTIEELKTTINAQWIFNNKEKLFKNSSLIKNSNDILKIKFSPSISNQINVLLEIKIEEQPFEFHFSIKGLKESTPLPEITWKPKDLDELRRTSPEVIAKLQKYDSSEYGIVVTPERQIGDICWIYGVSGASEVSILKEGLAGYSKDGIKTLNFDEEYDVEEVVQWRDIGVDKLGNSNYDFYRYERAKAGQPDNAWMALTQRNLSKNKDIALENYSIINKFNNQDLVDIDSIKKEVAKYGAVQCSYYSGWGRYGGRSEIYLNTGDKSAPDHSVSIVGWDDTIDANVFTNVNGASKPTRNGAWIIKNSWGRNIGKNGYFYLSYDSVISEVASFDWGLWDENSNYLYYYDGNNNNLQSFLNAKKSAVIFKAQKASSNTNEQIDKVVFGLRGGNDIKVKVDVYLDVVSDFIPYTSEENPTSGKLVTTKTITYDYPGMKTLELDNSIELKPNQTFSIVVTILSSEGDSNLMFVKEKKSYNDMSYVYDSNEQKWVNSLVGNSSLEKNVSVRIRAITSTKSNSSLDNDLDASIVTLREEDYKTLYRYNDVAKNKKPLPIVSLNNKILEINKDYIVEYDENIYFEPISGSDDSVTGYGKIIVKGIGNYHGINEISWPIIMSYIPNLEEFAKYGFNVILDQDPTKYRSTKLQISKSYIDQNKFTNWNQIKLPKNFEWIYKENSFDKKTNEILYVGQDHFVFRKVYFSVELIES